MGCNLKNIQEALNYLSKMEALNSQYDFRKGRSSPDQRECDQGPQIRQATDQNDKKRQADIHTRLLNYSDKVQFNWNGRKRGHHVPIGKDTQMMVVAEGEVYKTIILMITKDKNWIHEQMS